MASHPEGPAGGTGKYPYDDEPATLTAKIGHVTVSHGTLIDSIQVVFLDGGLSDPRETHGGGGGTRENFVLGAGEYIVGVSGRAGQYVDSLTITSNKKTRTYGHGGVSTFNFTANDKEEIIGFFGTHGTNLDSIGVYIRPRA
jgi:Jacalin-like lectin domain